MQNEGVEHSFAASNASFLLTKLCKVFICQIWWFTWLENNNQICMGVFLRMGSDWMAFQFPILFALTWESQKVSINSGSVADMQATLRQLSFPSQAEPQVEDETCPIWDSSDQAHGWALHPKTLQACTCFWAQMFVRIFSFFLATLHGMWDLSSLTRDRTWAPCSRSVKS